VSSSSARSFFISSISAPSRSSARSLAGAASAAGERRVAGELAAADDDGIVVRTGLDDDGAPVERRLAYADIDRARTVFEWGSAAKPGGPRPRHAESGPQRHQGTSNEKKRDHTS
jgi:hypothetical protein